MHQVIDNYGYNATLYCCRETFQYIWKKVKESLGTRGHAIQGADELATKILDCYIGGKYGGNKDFRFILSSGWGEFRRQGYIASSFPRDS